MNIVWLIIGLVLILAGANFLTDGSAELARRWGMSDLMVGLTVVAFGTSAPELVISIIAAAQGSAGIAIGNTVGSNIFNIFAIIGVTALVRPIVVERGSMTKDIPLMVLSALVLLAIGNGPLLDGVGEAVISRVDGILLLLFFAIFMRYTFTLAKKGSESDTPVEAGNTAGTALPLWRALLYVVGGLAALIWGGDRFVDGASGLAASLGVSDAVIGLTVVAVGTSLPEFAASVAAAIKGRPGMAVGNVIGSNIFNVFLVLGTAATVSPLPFAGIGNFDLLTLVAASFLFWLFAAIIRRRTITRGEGALMATCYVAYIVYQVLAI